MEGLSASQEILEGKLSESETTKQGGRIIVWENTTGNDEKILPEHGRILPANGKMLPRNEKILPAKKVFKKVFKKVCKKV